MGPGTAAFRLTRGQSCIPVFPALAYHSMMAWTVLLTVEGDSDADLEVAVWGALLRLSVEALADECRRRSDSDLDVVAVIVAA